MFGSQAQQIVALQKEVAVLKANQAKVPVFLRVALQVAGIPLGPVKEKLTAFVQTKRQTAADAKAKIAELTALMRDDTAQADQARGHHGAFRRRQVAPGPVRVYKEAIF